MNHSKSVSSATPQHRSAALVITGMHRSGTSLAAGLLAQAGVNLGERQLGVVDSNKAGHFEDLDILELHSEIFVENSLSEYGWTLVDSCLISPDKRSRAQQLIAHKSQHALWGFKDPRTCLFLPFWHSEIPEAKFIFTYRTPWEVADSLYRRAAPCDEIFSESPHFAIQLWQHYNRRLIAFFDLHPSQCLLIEAGEIAEHPNDFLKVVQNAFALPIAIPKSFNASKASLNATVLESEFPELVSKEYPEVLDTLTELHKRSTSLSKTPEHRHDSPAVTNPSRQTVDLRTWGLLRYRDGRYKELAKDMLHVQGILGTTYERQHDILKRLELLEASNEKAGMLSRVQNWLQQRTPHRRPKFDYAISFNPTAALEGQLVVCSASFMSKAGEPKAQKFRVQMAEEPVVVNASPTLASSASSNVVVTNFIATLHLRPGNYQLRCAVLFTDDYPQEEHLQADQWQELATIPLEVKEQTTTPQRMHE